MLIALILNFITVLSDSVPVEKNINLSLYTGIEYSNLEYSRYGSPSSIRSSSEELLRIGHLSAAVSWQKNRIFQEAGLSSFRYEKAEKDLTVNDSLNQNRVIIDGELIYSVFVRLHYDLSILLTPIKQRFGFLLGVAYRPYVDYIGIIPQISQAFPSSRLVLGHSLSLKPCVKWKTKGPIYFDAHLILPLADNYFLWSDVGNPLLTAAEQRYSAVTVELFA